MRYLKIIKGAYATICSSTMKNFTLNDQQKKVNERQKKMKIETLAHIKELLL